MSVNLIFTIGFVAKAQAPDKKQLFRPPLDVPMLVTAGFCEFRPDHFHAGIDLSTYGAELPVYAIADGYVNRIRVSAFGYGLAIYITHPEGYMSVYAHLSRFNAKLQEKVFELQKQEKSFEIDFEPKENEWPVRKSDVLAYTGNTGSSSAPHLHFEIRDAKLDRNFNPIEFGLAINDNFAPVLNGIGLAAYKQFGQVEGKHQTLIMVQKAKKPVEVSGMVGILVNGHDAIGKSASKSQFYELMVFVDNKKIFHSRYDNMSFETSRYVNAAFDMAYFRKSKQRWHACYEYPEYRHPSIKETVNRGWVLFNDAEIHQIKVVARDYHGKESVLTTQVKSSPWKGAKGADNAGKLLFVPGKPLKHVLPHAFVELGPNAFFDTLALQVQADAKLVAKGWQIDINANGSQVFLPYTIQIHKEKLSPDLPVAKCGFKGGSGKFYLWQSNDNGFQIKPNETGRFTLMVDETPPTLRLMNAKLKKQNKLPVYKGGRFLQAGVSDNLSGLGAFECYINGDWVLTEYDARRKALLAHIPSQLPKGEHAFILHVFDKAGNKSSLEGRFEK